MKPRYAWLLAFGMMALSGFGQARLDAPGFPPKDWSVSITLRVSEDIAATFLERKPAKEDFFHVDSVYLRVRSDGALSGPRKHFLLTGKLPSSNFADHEVTETAIAYLPVTDQKMLYERAMAALNSFAFTNDVRGKAWELSGADVSVRLSINDRDVSIEYGKLEPQNVPEAIRDCLAVLRRNLPPEYTRLFEFLKVPKLASLSADQAKEFAKCHVHDESMQVEDVPISYGYPAPREKYWKAAKESFPNASLWLPGGCTVFPSSPKSSTTLYCVSCRATEKRWREENDGN